MRSLQLLLDFRCCTTAFQRMAFKVEATWVYTKEKYKRQQMDVKQKPHVAPCANFLAKIQRSTHALKQVN